MSNIDHLQSEHGWLEITCSEHALQSVFFVQHKQPATPNALSRETRQQLAAYFAGKLTRFDLPLNATGTAFQQQVWAALCDIPYGETRSYGQLANAINKPKAVRAVGAANGRNPISIIVPCHRVIGANGTLTGYAGGLSRKAWLLELEKPR